MAGEEKYLNKDLKEVLKQMSQTPANAPGKPRPVTPGPKLPTEPVRGTVSPATGQRVVRDPAIELFRFYAYGTEPAKPVEDPLFKQRGTTDTKKVTVSSLDIDSEEKMIRKARKEAGLPVKRTENRRRINQAVRQGTFGGMTRAPGSKPPVHLAKNLPIALEVAAERARRRAEADVIRDALEKAFGSVSSEASEFRGKYTPEINKNAATLSRDEQKYLELLQRRIQDLIMDREAAIAEELARRGQTTPTLDEVRAMQEAERRTLEARQVAERTRLSRQKTEISMRKPPIIGGKALGALGIAGAGLEAYALYQQMLAQAAAQKEEIQSNLIN